MIIISHRSNLAGPNSAYFGENHPSSINAALKAGFNVEIDVWFKDNKFIIGHDLPQYEVAKDYFYNSAFWIHCKNIEALDALTSNPVANTFFHNTDDCTLTSQQYIWTYPNLKNIITKRSIAVIPEIVDNWNIDLCAGVCTDFPSKYL